MGPIFRKIVRTIALVILTVAVVTVGLTVVDKTNMQVKIGKGK